MQQQQQQQQRSQGYCREGGAQSRQALTGTEGPKQAIAASPAPAPSLSRKAASGLCQQHSRRRRGPGLLDPSPGLLPGPPQASCPCRRIRCCFRKGPRVLVITRHLNSWPLREQEVLSSRAMKKASGHPQWPESQPSCSRIPNQKARPVL